MSSTQESRENLVSSVRYIYIDKKYADVTLVSDDQKQFKAHKMVLSACSSVLKAIILENSHPHPLLYLRNINHQELEAILQFMYFGKVSINEDRVDIFLRNTKDLQIKQCSSDFNLFDIFHNMAEDKKNFSNPVNINDKFINEHSDNSRDPKEMMPSDTKKGFMTKKSKLLRLLFKCTECTLSFASKGSLVRHSKIRHEGVQYYCGDCDYHSSRKNALKIHRQSKHEGIKYSCDQCEYVAPNKVQLRRHLRAKHEGFKPSLKLSCDECEYKATQRGNLEIHKQSKHKGCAYFCDQCNFSAKWPISLKVHIYSQNTKLLNMHAMNVIIKHRIAKV